MNRLQETDILGRSVAISLTMVIYLVVIINAVPLPTAYVDIVLFAGIFAAVPILSSILLMKNFDAGASQEKMALAGRFIVFFPVTVITGLALVSIVLWFTGLGLNAWQQAALWWITVAVIVHICVVGLCRVPQLSGAREWITKQHFFSIWARVEPIFNAVPNAYALVLLTSTLICFQVTKEQSFFSSIYHLLRGLTPPPSNYDISVALFSVIVVTITIWRLFQFEISEMQTRPKRLELICRCSIWIMPPIVFYTYFDYRFNTDVLHFLTNIGPAWQVISSGGIPLVDTFSQYGPGPMLMTWLGFSILSPSFHAANIVAQLHSLTLYSIVLFILFRLARYRLTSLVLGYLAIGVCLTGWAAGNYSLNEVPSSMGMRYLPCALVVLAITILPYGRRTSGLLAFFVGLASLWSFEAALGTIVIVGLFILQKATSDRSVSQLFKDMASAIVLPILVAYVMTSTVIWLVYGKVPDFVTYFLFVRLYNPASEFWAISSDGTFGGWAAVATVLMIAISMGWLSAFDQKNAFGLVREKWIYVITPVAALCVLMSSYYVSRSVDFTLTIVILPFSVLAIPAFLELARNTQVKHEYFLTVLVLCVVICTAVFYSLVVLHRGGGPYKLAFGECLQDYRCLPSDLVDDARERYQLRPMLDQSANPNYFDSAGLAKEAIELIEKYEPNRNRIALFLGVHPQTIWSVHTNAVLLLVQKGHRWPISYVLSDELNERRSEQIVAADIRLDDGEVIFVRADESKLGGLESGILAQIRETSQLCPLPQIGPQVVALRVSYSGECL